MKCHLIAQVGESSFVIKEAGQMWVQSPAHTVLGQHIPCQRVIDGCCGRRHWDKQLCLLLGSNAGNGLEVACTPRGPCQNAQLQTLCSGC